eukprot:4354006-Pyramimonas_sp.AAC.1
MRMRRLPGPCSAGWTSAVAMSQTFQFNEVIAVDTFNASLEGGSVLVPNCVCHGTNLQIVEVFGGTSEVAWKALLKAWARPFGPPPGMLPSDGGPELKA